MALTSVSLYHLHPLRPATNVYIVFTIGWAAVFAVLVDWFNGTGCGSAWNWVGFSLHRSNTCGQWKAAQAFSFLSMIMWLASAIFGVIVVHRLSKRAAANHNHSRV